MLYSFIIVATLSTLRLFVYCTPGQTDEVGSLFRRSFAIMGPTQDRCRSVENSCKPRKRKRFITGPGGFRQSIFAPPFEISIVGASFFNQGTLR